MRLVRYFTVVAEHQHFGRAAEALHVAQPSLSRQIRHLEQQLGARLLDRTPQGSRLTEAGETQIGLTTYYGYVDFVAGALGFLPYVGHAGNSWGNGSAFPLAFDTSLGRMILDYNADRSAAWPAHALARRSRKGT